MNITLIKLKIVTLQIIINNKIIIIYILNEINKMKYNFFI